MSEPMRLLIDQAVQKVKPGLVRIHVVDTYYSDGRELKFEASGSGAVITPQGHVITNHHVAGHAKRLKCTFSDKSEYDAELVGADPLTDIAVIKIVTDDNREFPTVDFGDSSLINVGDHVLAMGSPLALSQSVTLGIVSNTEMIMPEWMGQSGGLEQDGEDVGALVIWIGHDAEIFGGNSGGPLVNLQGQIVGINEIKMGLGGAIPGNLAQEVAKSLIADGKVRRAWIGIDAQPRLKHSEWTTGVLVSGALKGAPAAEAGFEPGDILMSIGGHKVDVQFPEQLPDFNRIVAALPIGEAVEAVILRGSETKTLHVTPVDREARQPKEFELKEWGLTVRDLSFMMAREMKRENTEGVLITSVRPGGPAGDAKPVIRPNDVILKVGERPVKNVAELRAETARLTEAASDPVPVLTQFERENQQFVTVIKVGISELKDPGLEVKKAWLPVETQVMTREISELLGKPELTGFRITHVYKDSTAEKAGLKVGDFILAVDGEPMTASAPEDYEELSAYIRQYKVDDTVELDILRDGEQMKISVQLLRSPKLAREMRKYRNEEFEFTVREITFFDRAEEQWSASQEGVLVEDVQPGGWAALGNLSVSDLVLEVNGQKVNTVDEITQVMDGILAEKPKAVVLKVLRGIHTFFIELEPKWDVASTKG
ncbi:MAG: PDZ domain-containing protein [Candidatus Hydrogenedentes bacterium]|nr:PDZ domain-containing protein [Candidatus Hydrogenedentota bacterium]